MSVPLSDLVPDVMTEVAKCSPVLARKAIEDATIQFFKDSLAFNVTLAEIPVSVGTSTYALANPAGYQIISPRFADYDKRRLDPTSEEALDLEWSEISRGFTFSYSGNSPGRDSENWRYAESDRPWLYYCPTPNELRIVGIPTTLPTVGLNVNVYCHPIKGVQSIDDWIYNSWNDVIVSLAVSDLMLKPEKTFFNPKAAAILREAYDERVGQLATAALRGHQRNNRQNLRVKTWR